MKVFLPMSVAQMLLQINLDPVASTGTLNKKYLHSIPDFDIYANQRPSVCKQRV